MLHPLLRQLALKAIRRKSKRAVHQPNTRSAVFPVAISFLSVALLLTFSFTLIHKTVNAQFTQQINYQGKLLTASSTTVADGLYHMRFRLYSAPTGGSLLWEEDRSLAAGNRADVRSGLFSMMLGSSTPLSSLNFNQPLYLEVEIGGTASSGWETLSPRKRIGAVPAAFYAKDAGTAATATVAQNAELFGGLATTSFLRSNQNATFTAGTLTIDTGAALTVLGAGTFANATATQLYTTTFGINSEYFTDLTGTGLTNVGGALTVATTTLGLGNGTFLGLTDTPSAFSVAGGIPFESSGALAFNSNFSFNGTSLTAPIFNVLGQPNSTSTLLSFNGSPFIKASTTRSNLYIGTGVGGTSTSQTDNTSNIAVGFDSLFYNTTGSDNNAIGVEALHSNTIGFSNSAFGNQSLSNNVSGSYNVAIGDQTLASNIDGIRNTAIGSEALWDLESGHENVALGYGAGFAHQLGGAIFIGAYAGVGNYGSSRSYASSTLIGYRSGFTGSVSGSVFNTFLGYRTGYAITTGSNNLLLGANVGDALTTGSNNIAIGYDIDLPSNTGSNQLTIGNLIFGTGINGTGTTLSTGNVGIGTTSPYAKLSVTGATNQTNPLFHVASSTNSPYFTISNLGVLSVTSGATSTFDAGIQATTLNLTGATSSFANGVNIATGCYAVNGSCLPLGATTFLGLTDTPSAFSVAGGIPFESSGALAFNSNFSYNGTSLTAPIFNVLGQPNSTSTLLSFNGSPFIKASTTRSNLYIGTGAGGTSTSQTGNTRNIVVGFNSLFYNTTGSHNTAIGVEALHSNTTGSHNNAIGFGALRSNTIGFSNIAFGNWSLYSNVSGAYNVGIGEEALISNIDGMRNIAIGSGALGYLNRGHENVALGAGAGLGHKLGGAVFIGASAGAGIAGVYYEGNFSYASSTLIGYQSGYTGSESGGSVVFNTFLGYRTGYAITTGSNNLLLGANVGDALTTGSNNIAIGYDIDLPSNTGSNQLTIGNLIFGTGINGTGTTLSTGNVGIGTTTPLARLTVRGTTGFSDLFQLASSTNDVLLTVNYRGWLGIGSTTPTGPLVVVGTTSTSTFETSFIVDGGKISHNIASGVTSISNLNLGPMRFDDNAGWVSWIDLPVSAGVATSTVQAFSAQLDGIELLTLWGETIDDDGTLGKLRVVVGTTTSSILTSSNLPFGSFIVANGALCVDNTPGGADCDNSSRLAGYVYAEGSSFSGLDIAETYPTENETLSAGAIVAVYPKIAPECLTWEHPEADDGAPVCTEYKPKSIPFVDSATRAREATLLGIVSTEPGVTLGGFDAKNLRDYRQVAVALTGRVPVVVTNEGGNIEPGDRVALSPTTPGFGTKATTSSMTVGFALEPVVFTSGTSSLATSTVATSTVLVYVDLQDWTPRKVEALAEITVAAPVGDSWMGRVFRSLGAAVRAGVARFDRLFAGILTAERVETKELCVGEVCITEAEFLQMVQQLQSTQTGTPTGGSSGAPADGGASGDSSGGDMPDGGDADGSEEDTPHNASEEDETDAPPLPTPEEENDT